MKDNIWKHIEQSRIDRLKTKYRYIKAEEIDTLYSLYTPRMVENVSSISFSINSGDCPRCHNRVSQIFHGHYCGDCGQALKWQ